MKPKFHEKKSNYHIFPDKRDITSKPALPPVKKATGLIAIAAIAVLVLSAVSIITSETHKSKISRISKVSLSSTPEDNYPPNQWTTFCQSENGTRSTKYIIEYKIPTPCTQPLSATTDSSGNVWFTETNTGSVGKFDPSTKSFQEFKNPLWQKGDRSQTRGIHYGPKGDIWFTDSQNGLVWKFDPSTKNYYKFTFPMTPGQSEVLPQMLKADGPNLIVNDFYGRKISIFNPAGQTGSMLKTRDIRSPGNYNFTSEVAVDPAGKIWYTIWTYEMGGNLIRYDPTTSQFSNYTLPSGIISPNGISIDSTGKIWITDTGSSMFISFDPKSQQFTKYITSPPPISTYGNASGLIKTPITRPYWTQFDDQGRLWFNEQVANTLSVFDPEKGSLVEYLIPSKNPHWSDCGNQTDCGVAQALTFTVYHDKVWFPEWVENNIGMLDSSIPLPISENVSSTDVKMHNGQNKTINLILNPTEETTSPVHVMTEQTASRQYLKVTAPDKPIVLDKQKTISVNIHVGNAPPGTYKILISARYQDVTISKFVTITIT